MRWVAMAQFCIGTLCAMTLSIRPAEKNKSPEIAPDVCRSSRRPK